MSQTEFARRFGFPVATLRNWESGKRAPRGPSLALLRIIAYHPAIAMRAMIRARRAHERKPDPICHPPRVPGEVASPRAVGDDFEP